MTRSGRILTILLTFALLFAFVPAAFAAPPGPDPTEPGNDAFANAEDVTAHLGFNADGSPGWGREPWVGRRTLSPQSSVISDVDWYKVTVKASDLTYSGFSIMIDAWCPGSGDPVIEVYTDPALAVTPPPTGTDGAAVWSSDDAPWWSSPPGSASVALMPQTPGTYYVRVRSHKDALGYSPQPFYYDLRVKIGQMTRVAGPTRIETAIKIADEGWTDTLLSGSVVDTVTLAAAYNYPDALSGSFLAGLSDAPLLLVPTHGIPASVIDVLKRKGVKEVDLLGSTDAIGADVEADLLNAGFAVKRFAGANRVQTAAAIAREGYRVMNAVPGPEPRIGLLAFGYNFPDALSATTLSYHAHLPILLTHTEALDAASAQVIADLGLTDIVILGSTQVVGAAVENQLKGQLGVDHVLRIAGLDRYDTAVRFARWATDQTGPGVTGNGLIGTAANNTGPSAASALLYNRVGFASGENYPDALAGGAYCGYARGPLLLTRKGAVPEVINGADGELEPGQAQYFNGDPIGRSMLFGGPPAITDDVFMILDATTGFAGPGH